jgi:hypothetical protein
VLRAMEGVGISLTNTNKEQLLTPFPSTFRLSFTILEVLGSRPSFKSCRVNGGYRRGVPKSNNPLVNRLLRPLVTSFSADDDVVFRVLFSFFVRLRITVDVPKLCNSFYWNILHFR